MRRAKPLARFYRRNSLAVQLIIAFNLVVKILVTGGTGYLGTHVRKYLGADDLSRRSGRDILDRRDAEMVRDYDLVVHLAAQLDRSPDEAENVFLTNVEGTVNLLREMKEGSAFVFASTRDVYGRFADNFAEVPESCPTLYAGQSALEWSKLIAERYVEYYSGTRGFRAAVFRLSTVYARNSDDNTPNFVGHYADAINKGERLVLAAGGKPRRDLMHVDDLSQACLAFGESVITRGLYNIGGGRENAVTLLELVRKMEEISGLQAVIDEDRELPAPAPFDYVSDISAAKHELGWEPKTGLDEGLATLF